MFCFIFFRFGGVMENEVEMLIPIAETFTSVQGEGGQSGIRMTFFRLAGCTVGKRFPSARYQDDNVKAVAFVTPHPDDICAHKDPLLPIYPDFVNECTTFDGRHFPCDTNYRLTEKASISDLLGRIPVGVEWASITGGEPLMHMEEVVALCAALRRHGLNWHIETSATIIPAS